MMQQAMMQAFYGMPDALGQATPGSSRRTQFDALSPTAGDDGGRSVRKYTCRFDIGIENDKEFQVARRIIGTKGANMKRIVKQSDAKLRLRGRGSGFLEGAQRQESSEPLHLCISCKDPQGYGTAVEQVEILLRQVYLDYQDFCRQRGRPVVDVRVQKREHPLLLTSGGSTRRNRANSGLSDMSPTSGNPFGGFGGSPSGTWSQAGTPWHRSASMGLDTPLAAATPGTSTNALGGSLDPFSLMGVTEAMAGLDMSSWSSDKKGAGEKDPPPPEEIEQLINERNEARRGNNFAEADRIRLELRQRGIALMDEPGGRGKGSEVTTWRYWRQ